MDVSLKTMLKWIMEEFEKKIKVISPVNLNHNSSWVNKL